jgi:hypothetical protein
MSKIVFQSNCFQVIIRSKHHWLSSGVGRDISILFHLITQVWNESSIHPSIHNWHVKNCFPSQLFQVIIHSEHRLFQPCSSNDLSHINVIFKTSDELAVDVCSNWNGLPFTFTVLTAICDGLPNDFLFMVFKVSTAMIVLRLHSSLFYFLTKLLHGFQKLSSDIISLL